MLPMTGRLGMRHAGCIVFITLLLAAGTAEPQIPPGSAPTEIPVPGDSSIGAGPATVSIFELDSTRTADSTFVLDALTAPGPTEDARALADRLERLTMAATYLVPDERRVFDEIIAAAREMLAGGDPEATRLLIADAVDVLRQGSP